jgi:hypothetical protein
LRLEAQLATAMQYRQAETLGPRAANVPRSDVGPWVEAVGDDAGPCPRRHRAHIGIVGVQDRGAVSGQQGDELPLLLCRGFEAAEVLVVIATYGGYDANLRLQDACLCLDAPRPAARQLLEAELGVGPDRKQIGDHPAFAVPPGIEAALPRPRQNRSD